VAGKGADSSTDDASNSIDDPPVGRTPMAAPSKTRNTDGPTTPPPGLERDACSFGIAAGYGWKGAKVRGNLRILESALLLLAAVACTTGGRPAPPTIAPIAVPTQSPTRVPTRTPDPFPNPVVRVTGEEEVVYDWSTDHCEGLNVPDLGSRAFRGADGQVQLILSHFENYRMIGPDLNSVKIDCNRIMRSTGDADPAMFTDQEWIAAPYTEDGQTIYAIVHNEYHGYEHRGQCREVGHYVPECWYNSLTLVVSTDGGHTYTHALTPPAHMVAGFPYVYKPDAGVAGLREPSNIIRAQDGYYYEFANAVYYDGNKQGVCLMRTTDVSDPTAWRFWNGKSFDGTFINPYLSTPANPDEHLCPPLAPDEIGASLNFSITYNTYLKRYVLVGNMADQRGTRTVWGFYYSFSFDLIHWTHRKLLKEITLPWTAEHFDDVMYHYPSLLDPLSDSRNFDTTGETAYLYYTRFNHGQGSLDRDLIRVPVEFLSLR
jgi:hypothetical protein